MCSNGLDPVRFWDLTLREIGLIKKSRDEQDSLAWNRTASMMSLYYTSKQSKGKKATPADFHPYVQAELENKKPKTKDEVFALVEKMKNFNGK